MINKLNAHKVMSMSSAHFHKGFNLNEDIESIKYPENMSDEMYGDEPVESSEILVTLKSGQSFSLIVKVH